MSEDRMITLYLKEIEAKGGRVPTISKDPEARPMNIAKLQDKWRKLCG